VEIFSIKKFTILLFFFLPFFAKSETNAVNKFNDEKKIILSKLQKPWQKIRTSYSQENNIPLEYIPESIPTDIESMLWNLSPSEIDEFNKKVESYMIYSLDFRFKREPWILESIKKEKENEETPNPQVSNLIQNYWKEFLEIQDQKGNLHKKDFNQSLPGPMKVFVLDISKDATTTTEFLNNPNNIKQGVFEYFGVLLDTFYPHLLINPLYLKEKVSAYTPPQKNHEEQSPSMDASNKGKGFSEYIDLIKKNPLILAVIIFVILVFILGKKK
jgi:hypothetical protein